jgi:hypothetical protein
VPRGGKRYGTPGKSYSQRSDLNVAPRAATGQQYGKAGAQLASQRQVPVARPATDVVPTVAPAPTAPRPLSGTIPGLAPGTVTPLDAPTERPNEPITAGLPIGPGAGPEVLGALGAQPDDDGVGDLAPYLPMLEFMASQPGASTQTRNFVRRLRGAKPVQ